MSTTFPIVNKTTTNNIFTLVTLNMNSTTLTTQMITMRTYFIRNESNSGLCKSDDITTLPTYVSAFKTCGCKYSFGIIEVQMDEFV